MTPRFWGGRGPLAIHVGARQTHKGGEHGRDCQDAWWAGVDPPRVAVADGATRAFFPREWAWLLAEHFCRAGNDGIAAPLLRANESDAWRAALAEVRAEWREAVRGIIERSPARSLLENRLQRKDPAAATLVGVELDPEAGTWRAALLGDSCLMRFDRSTGEFLGSDPVDDPDRFDSHPEALLSVADSPRETPPRPEPHGTMAEDEVLVLATDALARWLLELPPRVRWTAVTELLDTDDALFDARVSAARRGAVPGAPAMDDDDVTLVVVAFGTPLRGTHPLREVAKAVPPPFSHQKLRLVPQEPAESTAPASADRSAPMFAPARRAPEPPGPPAPEADAAGADPFVAEAEVAAVAVAPPGASVLPQDDIFSRPASPPPLPEPGPAIPEGVPVSADPAPGDSTLTVVHASPETAEEPERDTPDAPGPPPSVVPPAAGLTLFPGAREQAESPVDPHAPSLQPDPERNPSTAGEEDPAPADPGGERVPTEPLPQPSGERAAPKSFDGDPGTRGGPNGRMNALHAWRTGLIEQLAGLGARPLAILMLTGWMLFLATALGAAVMWPRGDKATAGKGTVTGEKADSVGRPAATGPAAEQTASAPVAATLPAETSIFLDSRDTMRPRLVLRDSVTAMLTEGPGNGWRAIDLQVWVARDLAARDGDRELVTVGRGVNLRAAPRNGRVLFTLAAPDSFPAAGEEDDGWYPVRVSGFVRRQ